MAQAAVDTKRRALAALLHPTILFVVLLLLAMRAFAGSATLAWDPVSSPALAGYMLYYGPSADNYTSKIDMGSATTGTVNNLMEGSTYHFAVTAYDAARVETSFSNDASATIAAAAPVAGFSVSATSGVAPLGLNFTNTSTGAITNYSWSFGDGTSSTAQNPSHVYSVAGVYTVALRVSGGAGSNTKTMSNYINVKSATSGDTTPPGAPSTLAASASGTSVNLAWKASTDNVGISGYRIERCQGAGCTSFAQIATATATTFGNTGLATGVTYSYRVRATDAAGNLSGYSNTATVTLESASTGAAALIGSIAASTASADLTAMGTSDWASWPSYIHSATGGGQIGNVAMIGGASPKTYNGDARRLAWSNGTPTMTGSSTSGVMASGRGKGVVVTATADTTTRRLVIYLGAQNTTVDVAAHLSDGSAPDYVTTFSGGKARQDGVLTLQYRAASAGRTITVQLSQSAGGGNVSVQAAALAVTGASTQAAQ